MRESSNPVFRSLPKGQGGYAQFGTGAASFGAQQVQAEPYATQYPDQQQAGVSRPMTIDDVVTKTGITLAVVTALGVLSYFMVSMSPGLMMPFVLVGGLGGFALIMIATFGRKQDNPAIVLSYAALEGVFLGAASFLFANLVSTGGPGMIAQAIFGTVGVFVGMLVVYRTGAIRVTPKFTRMMVAALFGVVAIALLNMVLALFGVGGGEGFGLRSGGPLAIIFSLVCIGLAAFMFLIDFDSADQMIRAGAPEKAAWGVALGLTVTLVWLYLEILRLLSYFNND
ncbi:Bax inhibitor-1/YccA family protein [Mycobacterium frederiksbergense]|uniref:Bax inhibitor-1/YccA family protein n=1 Tax=Mycolicibacterium frederiksbergense TaxID=117567 RepID=A0A6H0S804_9MYCO|nr:MULTISPECIES: Bax inhibitor-1/YccA family protein [Mycobacteriaceae]MBJ7466043.1 Bax inhibitor-1/YccA family protein [Mycolicibacterium sp.]MDZ7884985.1 Bax inhibitor-1/YccA family protein [Mycobacterium sp.]MBX9919507.1 Bax inhibitor-1/YccA family protein [Mycolicibacterium frederiksbergense]MCV7043517.1 Bax inhibitor-1/YccA family protein [Mycolicibacterium frederiksbergense]MDO0975231.1 Bax inhibitor-1/YccA family protein [Mycolicibacterium frederiksbergense]